MRMSGGSYEILPLEVEALENLPINASNPFWCILSSKETVTAVRSFLESCAHPVLHSTTTPIDDELAIYQLDRNAIFQYCKQVGNHLESINSNQVAGVLRSLPPRISTRKARKLTLTRRQHFVTFANELTLEGNHYEFAAEAPLMSAPDNAPYISAICASAEAITLERLRVTRQYGLKWPPPFNLILTCPGFYRHIYSKKLRGNAENRLFRKIISTYRRQTNYSIETTSADLNDLTSPEALVVIEGYRREISSYSICVGIKSSNHFAPVYRLPPSVNLIYDEFALLGACSRTNPQQLEKQLHKQNRLFQRISKRLADAVPREYLGAIDQGINRIKLIANAPLEWLPIRGLPLMIRHEVSRIPTTPGNATVMQSVMSHEVAMTSDAFKDILVVRSFESMDEIRNMMTIAIDVIRPQLSADTRIRIVDVSTPEEFLDAVNQFHGALMVFDGHGKNSVNGIGAVVINGKPVDLYQFRTRLRVPPIVILSSCDTHSIDGSHASAANSFLMLGAITVLGTLLPVRADYAASFAARLMLRINQFIPIITKESGGSVRWSTVVSGMQKMVYISEQVRRVFDARGQSISDVQHKGIQLSANNMILIGDPEWYEKSVKLIAITLNQNEETTRQELLKHQLVDVIKYIQLGNPDQILITDKHMQP